MKILLKRTVFMMASLLLALTLGFATNDVTVHAATDSTAPVCTGYRILNEGDIVKPGKLELELSFAEEGTGINYFMVGAYCVDNNGGRTEYLCEFYQQSAWGNNDTTGQWYVTNSNFGVDSLPKRPLYTETVTVSCHIPDTYSTGNWYIYWIDISDQANNRSGCAPTGSLEAANVGTSTTYKATDSVRGGAWGNKEPSFTVNPWFSVVDEFNYQFEDSISNPNLINHIANLNDGEAGKILLGSSANTTLPKEAFDAIRGKDVVLVAYDQNYQWIINGNDIVNESKDIDLTTSISTVGWDEFGTYDDSCIITFENNGVLPGKIEIRIRSDYMYNLYNKRSGLFLYYLNNNNAEMQNSANIGVNDDEDIKWCKFEISHNSKYLLTGTKVGTKVKSITPAIKLSASSYMYDGKVKKPSATVKDGSKILKSGKDYSVFYAFGRKNVGTYKVSVKLKGSYSGAKTVSFKINPKGTTLSKVTKAKKAATVKWKKQAAKMSTSRITGYQIQLATNSKFTTNKKLVTVKGYGKTSKKVTSLKGGKKYYVRIRTYEKVGNTTYYSSWSKVKTVMTGK